MYKFFWIGLVIASCSTPPPKKPPPAVQVEAVIEQNVPMILSTIGTVSGFITIDVRAQVTGQILEANVEEGQWVKKGDLLFTIDPSLYEASLNKAKGTLVKDKSLLELSKIKLERNAELVKKEFISITVYDELKSNVSSQEGQVSVDEADVRTAQINLDRTKIYAFSDGKISRFNFDPGNIVSPIDAQPLTTLQYLDQVNVDFSLPEKQFDRINNLQHKTPLKFDVFLNKGEQIGTGFVNFIDNKISSQTGTFLLRGVANNDKRLMWPGQFVRVQLILSIIENALLVPATAIQTSQKGPLIWLLDGDTKVKSMIVTLGEKYQDWVVIPNGLKKGDRVVVLGQSNLVEGATVFVQKKDAEKDPLPSTNTVDAPNVKGKAPFAPATPSKLITPAAPTSDKGQAK